MTLVQLPSGTIDLIEEEKVFFVQFNCECLDALPYCQAMCCKMRPILNAELEKDEFDKFPSTVQRTTGKRRFLAFEGTHCALLMKDNLCSTHQDKPRQCKAFHCSPGGKGLGITDRGPGWLLTTF